MADERVTDDEVKGQEVKPDSISKLEGVNLSYKPEADELSVKSPYDDFVEAVFTREIAKLEGAKPERIARVFQTIEDGDRMIHIAGEAEVVSDIADTMERGGYRVREWHIKRPADVSQEGEKVRPALDALLKSVPVPVLDNPAEFLRKALGLPFKAIDAGSEAIEAASGKIAEAAEALTEFNKGGKTNDTTE